MQVGFADPNLVTSGSHGTLTLTGANDLVIGSGSTANNNSLVVRNTSTLSANGNIVVGVDGTGGQFNVTNGSTVTSGGARLGVNAGSSGNGVAVDGATWTMNGSVRVGDKGSENQFIIQDGGTVTLTGANKNFYIGYDRAATQNILAVLDPNSTLSVKAAGADLVVSGNVTGSGTTPLNVLAVLLGGVVDANRTLVGDGGEIWGYAGTIKGDVVVGSGGTISSGLYHVVPGTITFTDNVDLSNGGTLSTLVASGTVGTIDVGGTLTLSGSSVLAFVGSTDPGTAYIVAHYGTLSGVFTSVFGLPAGATVDYNYHGLNEIAVITAVPEIAMASAGGAFALIACSLALLGRRGPKRRRHAG